MLRKNINKNTNNIIGILVILLWSIISILNPNMYFFNGDEIHACQIAKHLNYAEIIQLMRAEGHTFLWYFLIKPFLQYDLFYPWIIKVINFIFMLGSIILLWCRSPFNIITKTLIIFSYPFLLYYPTYARCYTIGIFLLFWLTILYDEKLKRPLLYSVLLFLTANTSLMACIGAGAFGILFLNDIYREKKVSKIILVSSIGLLTLFSLYIQWHDPIIPAYAEHVNFINNLKNTFFQFNSNYTNIKWLIIIGLFSSLLVPNIYFLKNKSACFIYTFTWTNLLILFSQIYPGNPYHHYFGFIYLILAYWISCKNMQENNKRKVLFKIFFYYICICLIFIKTTKLPYQSQIYNWDFFPKEIAEITNKNATIYADLPSAWDIWDYQNYFNLKSYNNKKINDLENFMNIYKYVETYNILDYIKKMEPNSYLLISDNKLAAARDYQEFNKKYKLVGRYQWRYLYKLD